MGSTEATDSQIALLRKAMLVTSALGVQLDAVGNNHNVPRPDGTSDDNLYRNTIKALAWLPKHILLSYYSVLGAIFGSQAALVTAGQRPWRVYEVNANEVIIEVPYALIATTNANATYLHGASGYANVAAGPSNQFTTNFDLQASSAVTVVGLAIHIETSPGTWTDYTITAYSFAAGTATVTVSAATLPTGGGTFYLEVPGDTVASYRGDYLATGGFEAGYFTAAGPNTNTLSVIGDATADVQPNMPCLISINGTFQGRFISALSYNNVTNITTVTITTTDVPGGQTAQVFLVAQEQADTATTPTHNDRIYLTGTGLYAVVQFYLDLLVRAAGIVVRLELI